MRQSFKVSFYLRSNYENKEGKSPVKLRIFLGGAMSDLGSTKIFVDKSQWNNNIKPKNSANCKTASEVSPRTKQVQKKYLNSPYLIKAMKARNKFEAAVMLLQRNGFAGNCHYIAPTKLIPALLTDSRAETLFKGGRTADLRHFLINPHGIDQYWAAYKITLRNHYNIIDIALWCDYVDMLRRLDRDIHSPKYVCPENLQESHDTAQRKLQAQRDKEAEAQRRQKAIENEERFQELKSPFFGITFTDGVIQVKVLESVQEYLEEGKALHHCVFTNEYYLKEQSLILSARIDGKRIETIEVNLDTLKVVQSRGLQNKNTEYHDRIIDLVNRNIRQIQSRVA